METDFISGATVASGIRESSTFIILAFLIFWCFIKLISILGWHAGKFKPKPKLRAGKENSNISMTNADAVESVMEPPTVQYVSSESQYVSEGSFSVFPPDHMFDYTSVDLGYIIPPQESMDSEFPMNEELTNLAETYHADNTTLGDVQTEDVCGMTENQVIFLSKFVSFKLVSLIDKMLCLIVFTRLNTFVLYFGFLEFCWQGKKSFYCIKFVSEVK